MAAFVFATMVTLSNTKDNNKYMEMTESWVKQLEFHGISRKQQLILVTNDVDERIKERVRGKYEYRVHVYYKNGACTVSAAAVSQQQYLHTMGCHTHTC